MYSARHCSTQVSGAAQRTSGVRPQRPSRCARGAAHRGSRRIAPAATRHARGRSARRPPPSLAADHAAALWQLWCRVGRTATITCQVVESHALYHHLQRATGAGRGANAGTAQRAGDGGRTYPANQHRVCIHTLSCVRRLTMLVPIGTAFGYGTRTHTLSRTLPRREASRCAVRPQSAAQKRAPRTRLEGDSRALGGRFDRSRRSIRPLAEVDSTRATGESTCREWRVGEFQGATRLHTLGRVGGRAVDSLTRLDPPPLARRPQPRSTRRREWAPAEGESTARHYRARRHFLCGPFLLFPQVRMLCGGKTHTAHRARVRDVRDARLEAGWVQRMRHAQVQVPCKFTPPAQHRAGGGARLPVRGDVDPAAGPRQRNWACRGLVPIWIGR